MKDYTILDLAKMVISPVIEGESVSVWDDYDPNNVTVEVMISVGRHSADYSPHYKFSRQDWNIAIQNALISIGKEK